MRHILIILSILLLSSPVFGQSSEEDSDYVIRTNNKLINISKSNWDFLETDYLYSKSYQSKTKLEGHKFKQIITVFLIKMTDERKREEIVKNEYFESWVNRPNSITVQFSIDKGDYWVLSRETYQTEENYPIQTNFSYSKVLVNFNGIEDMKLIEAIPLSLLALFILLLGVWPKPLIDTMKTTIIWTTNIITG